MEHLVLPKKRLSILKKRRSRSLSPSKSPPTERRISRRISFSGKHAVREFFIGSENKETIWGASYEESTDQNTVNSDQSTRQQQSMRMNHTKNETIQCEEAMDCSSIMATKVERNTISIAVSSSFSRERTTSSSVSIVADKENVFHEPPKPKSGFEEKKLTTTAVSSDAMEITMNTPPVVSAPKIKLFESMRQKKVASSNTLHQTKDMSLDVSHGPPMRKTTFALLSLADDNSRSPPPQRPSKIGRLNETTVNNADMSMCTAQKRPSVICKSPSKMSTNENSRNRTINFGSDTMNVTQAVRNNDLQESLYPLNATSMEKNRTMGTPKPSAPITNPYLKMFLLGTSDSSDSEIETKETTVSVAKAAVPCDRNVTAYDTQMVESIDLDHSNGAELCEYPAPMKSSSITEPALPKRETIFDQISIDKTLDFAMPQPIVPSHDKENVFVMPATPSFSDSISMTEAPRKVSLSDTVNTVVFNFHRDQIVNSTYRSNDSQLNVSPHLTEELIKDASIVTITPESSILKTDMSKRGTVYCNQSIRDQSTEHSLQNNKSLEMSVQATITPPVAPAAKHRRATCFKSESIDESVVVGNVVHEDGSVRISVSPAEAPPAPINISDDLVHDITTNASPAFIDRPTGDGHRKTIVFENTIVDAEEMAINVNATVHDAHMDLSITITDDHGSGGLRRKTCVFEDEAISVEDLKDVRPVLNSYQHLTMEQTQAVTSFASPSILLPPRMSMENSRPLDEFCQLTFIDDEDLELVDSIDGNDEPYVKKPLKAEINQTNNTLKSLTLQSAIEPVANAFGHRMANRTTSIAGPPPLTQHEQQAFQKSKLSRYSNDHSKEGSIRLSHTADSQDSLPTPAPAPKPVVDRQPKQSNRILEPMPSSSIPKYDVNTTETSYLQNVTVDKQWKDIKLDFSGYEKFRGLATPNDVCNAFVQRCEFLAERVNQLKEAATLNDIPEPQSQDVEAPSMKFLYFNKLAMLSAENAAKFEKDLEEKPVGAVVPVTPALLMLIQNKCTELKYWKIETTWFYRGRLILRHKTMGSYKVILFFDASEKAIDEHVNLYGKLLFSRARSEQCPIWLPRLRPLDRLRLKTIVDSEPINLLQMCPSSTDLSDFDEKMHTIVRAAYNKVTNLAIAVVQAKALLKMDNDLVYLHYRFDEPQHLRYITCNIKLNDLDRTGPECVQTIPFRAMHNDINALPKGVRFIEEFLKNSQKYLGTADE